MKNGQQLKSVVCSTKVIVLRKPNDEAAVLSCGGLPMIDASSDAPLQAPPDQELLGGTVMGKRYSEAESGVQVLCVAAGDGTLAINGHPLETEAVKQLPSSD